MGRFWRVVILSDDVVPEPCTKVFFRASTAYVRAHKLYRKPIRKAGSRHPLYAIQLDNGHIHIEHAWFVKKKE